MKIVQIIFILSFVLFSQAGRGQVKSSPEIQDFGAIWDVEEVVKPKPDLEYKIVIDLKTPVRDPSSINPGLNNIARMVNLHVAGGVNIDRLCVTAAVHGGATPVILNDEGYKQKYGVENPNLTIIRDLRASGIEIVVCSQSLIARGYDFDHVNPDVTKALSMLTIVTEKMMAGYGLLVFD